MKIRFSVRANRDLLEIHEFISKDSVIYARRTVQRLIEATRTIAQFPQSGRIIIRYNDPGIRESFHRNYRIAYQIGEDSINIITIRHVSRQIPNLE